jgi:hypothetical protein
MAPPSDAATAARRASARTDTRPGTRPDGGAQRRPPLRLFEPAPRRRPGRPKLRRSTMWLSGLLVIGSLLAVVAGDTMLEEGQVRLSTTQHQVASATAIEKSLQVAVAEKAAPPVVVSQAESQGLVAPTQVVYLPHVPLNVPLPVPQTAAAAPAAGTARSTAETASSSVPATR